jgi:predicted component of type VI protein secretion system
MTVWWDSNPENANSVPLAAYDLRDVFALGMPNHLRRVQLTGASTMNAHLRVLVGDSVMETIEVPQGELVIGRETDCQLQRESPFISRHHCLLLFDDSTLRIRDLGSKNGTFVNGRRIAGADTVLQNGHLVSVGEIVFEVSLVQQMPGQRLKGAGLPAAALQNADGGTQVLSDDTVDGQAPPIHSPATPQVQPVQFASGRMT